MSLFSDKSPCFKMTKTLKNSHMAHFFFLKVDRNSYEVVFENFTTSQPSLGGPCRVADSGGEISDREEEKSVTMVLGPVSLWETWSQDQ